MRDEGSCAAATGESNRTGLGLAVGLFGKAIERLMTLASHKLTIW